MSTRSTIAMRYPDGHVRAVYAHWDGDPFHNGGVLLEHYSNAEKLDQLLNLGFISVLAPEIGERHPFSYGFASPPATPEQRALWDTWVLAYHRDRGDLLETYEYSTVQEYIDTLPREQFNYLYLPTADLWLFSEGESVMHSLREELEGKNEAVY